MYENDNCSFVKYTLLDIGNSLPTLKKSMEFLSLIVLGVTINMMMINLLICLMGSFRIADAEYYKKWKQLQEEVKKLPTKSLDQDQPLVSTTPEGMKKKPEGLNTEENNHVNQLQRKSSPSPFQSPSETIKITKQPQQLSAHSGNQSTNLPAISKPVFTRPGPLTEKVAFGKRKIAESSKKFGDKFFQPKPNSNKVAPLRSDDISRCLEDLRENGRRQQLNQVDDKFVDRFKNKGMLSEFNRPLRGYLEDQPPNK